MSKKEIFRSGLYGLAIGDALGVPVEFLDRETVRNINVQNMMESGVPKGTYSDDTAMTLAMIDGMNKKSYDLVKIMNNFVEWFNTGKYSGLSYPFGLGNCCREAIIKYKKTKDINTCGCTRVRENGNGALMRILPACIYLNDLDKSLDEKIELLNRFTALTHAHPISLMANVIYYLFLSTIIETKDKNKAFDNIINFNYNKYFDKSTILEYSHILTKNLLINDDIENKKNGYVVPTVEGVIFSIMKNNNYKDSVLCAINLGFDTDTLGAITGSIAGILYGIEDIPKKWMNDLKNKELINELLNKYYDC